MRPIFLTGYMACGKTTLGRALARQLGIEFIDLDFYIEQRFRMPIPRIFEERGEEGFRKIESAMLREAGEFDNVVISCGGGTPCFKGNMEYMNSRGHTVWIRTTIPCILRRLTTGRRVRPLTQGKTPEELRLFVEEHLQSRIPYYSQAKIFFEGDELENRSQISSSVARFLPLLPPEA